MHLYLRVLPKLRRKVLVHVHDVRIPAGIHAGRARENHDYWTEQHLLSAYLLDNPKVRVLMGSHWAALDAADELLRLMAGKAESGGGSLWFELNGAIER